MIARIVAVLDKDNFWGAAQDITDVPQVLIERLRHYFLTYKLIPGEATKTVEIEGVVGAEKAHAIIEAARRDYDEMFGDRTMCTPKLADGQPCTFTKDCTGTCLNGTCARDLGFGVIFCKLL